MEIKGIYLGKLLKERSESDIDIKFIIYGNDSDGKPVEICLYTEDAKKNETIKPIYKIKISEFSTNKKVSFYPFTYVPKKKKVLNNHPIGTFELEFCNIPNTSLMAISLRPLDQRVITYTFKDNNGEFISEWIDLSNFESYNPDLEVIDFNDPPRENLVAKFSKKIKKLFK